MDEMDEIAEKPSQSPEEIRKGVDACWKEIAARPTSPIFQRLMDQERSDAARVRSPAAEPRDHPPPPPEPARPKPVAKPRKPPEREDVKAYRKALAAFETEQRMISRHVSLGHLKHDHARAVALGAATMVPIMLLIRRWFL